MTSRGEGGRGIPGISAFPEIVQAAQLVGEGRGVDGKIHPVDGHLESRQAVPTPGVQGAVAGTARSPGSTDGAEVEKVIFQHEELHDVGPGIHFDEGVIGKPEGRGQHLSPPDVGGGIAPDCPPPAVQQTKGRRDVPRSGEIGETPPAEKLFLENADPPAGRGVLVAIFPAEEVSGPRRHEEKRIAATRPSIRGRTSARRESREKSCATLPERMTTPCP